MRQNLPYDSLGPLFKGRENFRAKVLKAKSLLREAESLMRRVLEIDEASFGSEHPNVACDLNNLARLLQDTNRLEKAETLSRKHPEIFLLFTMRTGYEHPNLNAAFENYKNLLAALGRDEEEQQLEIESLIDSAKRRVSS